ncbi:MAG: peptidylprolyl isomerase [Pseudomonadota bacterium]
MPILNVNTPYGPCRIRLLQDRAPQTANYFLQLAETGFFEPAKVFRIVAPRNHSPNDSSHIHIVQFGGEDGMQAPRRRIPHEHTKGSGLTHTRGVVSAARFEPGQVYGSFFVCLRDEPSLDFGGARQRDGMGFAAFGEVVDGLDCIERLFGHAEDSEILDTPIPVSAAVAH